MAIIYKDGQDIPSSVRGTATALGNFDGVHRGHLYLFRQLRESCPNVPLSVVTFEPHPRQFFFPGNPPFRLTDEDEKKAALTEAGIQYIFQIQFDKQLAAQRPKEFVHEILYKRLGICHVTCGEDFAFGYHRMGNADFLKTEGETLGISVSTEKPLQDEQGVISSSRIRHLLRDGKPEQAAELLGRVWSLQGFVQHGDQRGRTIGFPTANIDLADHLEPMRGVYAVRITLPSGKIYQGVGNIGYRPTVNNIPTSRLEVFIFDFEQNIYGQEIKVELHHFLRPEQRFSDLEALTNQIRQDVKMAKQYFSIENQINIVG